MTVAPAGPNCEGPKSGIRSGSVRISFFRLRIALCECFPGTAVQGWWLLLRIDRRGFATLRRLAGPNGGQFEHIPHGNIPKGNKRNYIHSANARMGAGVNIQIDQAGGGLYG